MNKFEDLCKEINLYLCNRYKYNKIVAYLFNNNIIANEELFNIYLRCETSEYLWPPKTFVIARLNFNETRSGHGYQFLRFITMICIKFGYHYIVLESCVTKMSNNFGHKNGFFCIKYNQKLVTSDFIASTKVIKSTTDSRMKGIHYE